MSRVIITGGTGFIGRPLSDRLLGEGYDVVCLTRNPSIAKEKWGNKIKFVNWDGKSNSGEKMRSGVYFYELRTEGCEVRTRKMILVR